MKLVRTDGNLCVFRLGQRERDLFTQVLRRHPLVPTGYHRYTRAGATADDPANQALLDEAMAGHRAEHRERVEGLLNDPSRLGSDEKGWRLTLSREDIEWLLQVLNDVRVGSWLKAGCPDPDGKTPPKITAANAPFFASIEAAGRFETALLDVL